MATINYKSDFKLFEDGCDFTVPFVFEYRTAFDRVYEVSHVDGAYNNCTLQLDGRLMVVFDGHGLPPGILTCTRHFYLNEQDFHDGICNLWDKRDTGIVLTTGKTEDFDIDVEVPPFYNQDPKGDPGLTPHIGDNYNWWIGEEDTGILARGQNGVTPSIGDNGNWWINGEDTGKPSRGVQGERGEQGVQGLQGPQGEKGDKGDTGIQGEQGQQGIQGPKGDEGKTPVLEAGTITTLTAGEQATVGLIPNGTDVLGNPKYRLDFGIPKGDKGDTGEAGADGTNGRNGTDGEDGKTPVFDIGQVSTLPSGSTAKASIIFDGTDLQGNPKYALNLGIPQGPQGESGVAGSVSLSSLSDLDGSWINLLRSNKPTTLSGYGITDGISSTDADNRYVKKASVGRTTQAIYLNNGIPTQCSYAFGNSNGNAAISNGTRCTNLNADMVDGIHNGELTASLLNTVSSNPASNLNTLDHNGIYHWNSSSIGRPDTYGVLFQFSNANVVSSSSNWQWIFQLAASTIPNLYFRSSINGGSFTSKQIAFSSSSSDIRLKNKLSDISIAVKDIAKAPFFSFKWKDGRQKIEIGSTAQFWKDIIPDAVEEDNEGFLSMAYDRIALASAISIAREVVNLNKRIDDIERIMNKQNN